MPNQGVRYCTYGIKSGDVILHKCIMAKRRVHFEKRSELCWCRVNTEQCCIGDNLDINDLACPPKLLHEHGECQSCDLFVLAFTCNRHYSVHDGCMYMVRLLDITWSERYCATVRLMRIESGSSQGISSAV